MKLRDYINHANDYIYFSMQRSPLEKIISSEEPEHFMLIPNSLVIHRKEFVEVFKKYYLAELYELSNCFLGSYNEPYMFLHIVKTPVDSIRVSVYHEPAHLYRDDIHDPQCGKLRIVDHYTEEFVQYLDKLDLWRTKGVRPVDVEYRQQFLQVPWSEFNAEIVYTRFYLDYNSETRKVLKTEKLVNLSEIAEVIPSYLVTTGEVKTVKALDGNRMPKYPYIPELDTITYPATTVQLHKGDIVEHHEQFFLVDKEADFEVYAPPATNVIRANKDISPEYLFLYLKSKIAWRIRSVLIIPSGDHSRAVSRNLGEFPIVLPKEDLSVYTERFMKISSPDERVYRKLTAPDLQDTVEDILQGEIIDTIKLNNEALLRTQLEKDIRELNRCYEVKAYKSAIMLAGSMLETFLLDWISELDGINYFETDLEYQRNDGTTAVADLYYYIKFLKNQYFPNWNYCADLAHSIRINRNIVHVKLCLKRSEEITDELCLEIVENLKEIIESRYHLS